MICALIDWSPALGSSPEGWRGDGDWHWNSLHHCSCCASSPARPSRLRCWCSTPGLPADSLFLPRQRPPLLQSKHRKKILRILWQILLLYPYYVCSASQSETKIMNKTIVVRYFKSTALIKL